MEYYFSQQELEILKQIELLREKNLRIADKIETIKKRMTLRQQEMGDFIKGLKAR